MISVHDQENLTTAHQAAAATKPLNQQLRALQSKTPAPRARNNENATQHITKAQRNLFATPAPRTVARAPLGSKTTNVKAHAFKTPAQKPAQSKLDQTLIKPTARRSTRKKVYVEPQPQALIEDTQPSDGEDTEPESGYAPPPIVPLPDPPIDFTEIDGAYPDLQPEDCNRSIGEIYFQSPKDENGFSISLRKQEEEDRLSLDRDLEHLQEIPPPSSTSIPSRQPKLRQANINTVRAKSAAFALSEQTTARTHHRLPSAVTRETAASRSKRKPAFAVAQDTGSAHSAPAPVSKATIGFPKAKKPASILPLTERRQQCMELPASRDLTSSDHSCRVNEVRAKLSPQKLRELHGDPEEGSDLWLKLLEAEINSRHRDDDEDSIEHDIFDQNLDDRLRLPDGDDFVLELD